MAEKKEMRIENINQALEPFYSSKFDEERSGMGFTVMLTFMDEVDVKSTLNVGTTIIMNKRLTKQKTA